MNEQGKHTQASEAVFAYVPETMNTGAGNTAPLYNNIQQNDGQQPKPKRRHRGLIIAVIVVAVVVVLLLAAYFVGVAYFTDRLLPNTTIAGRDVSLDTPEESAAVLDDIIDNYSFTISGQGFEMNVTSEQAGLALNSQAIAEKMQSDVDPWRWPLEIMSDHDESRWLVATYGESTGLADVITAAVDAFNEAAQMPVNATYVYDEAQVGYTIVPEVYGTAIDAGKVVDLVLGSTTELQSEVDLGEDVLLMPTVYSDDVGLQETVDNANAMINVDLPIELEGVWIDEVTPELVASWTFINEEGSVSLDEDAAYRWAYEVAGRCDTVGKSRTFTTPYGETVTVSGGTYGWMTSSRSLTDLIVEAIYNHESTTLEIPTTSRGAVLNLSGGADWGSRYIDVNLSNQHVIFYGSDGSVIWESDCVTGLPNGERDTPTGVYYVYSKETDRYLEDEAKTYRSHVNYWMPFYGGDGFHDADWRSSFGGSIFRTDGSHGCVNLPSSKAAELYSIVYVGDTVVIHW